MFGIDVGMGWCYMFVVHAFEDVDGEDGELRVAVLPGLEVESSTFLHGRVLLNTI